MTFQRNQIIKILRYHCVKQYNSSCDTYGFFLIRFKDNVGILSCFNTEKDRGISFLKTIKEINHISVKIETLKTSGTIKTLISKCFNGDTIRN
jgi:RNase P/RNase MRP subunit POP5